MTDKIHANVTISDKTDAVSLANELVKLNSITNKLQGGVWAVLTKAPDMFTIDKAVKDYRAMLKAGKADDVIGTTITKYKSLLNRAFGLSVAWQGIGKSALEAACKQAETLKEAEAMKATKDIEPEPIEPTEVIEEDQELIEFESSIAKNDATLASLDFALLDNDQLLAIADVVAKLMVERQVDFSAFQAKTA
jgi:hypothetical protein